MNEQEIVKEIVNATVVDIYKDAAQPSLRVLGESLAQVVSLFAKPLGRTAEILEGNILKYLSKLEGISESDLVQPNIRIIVPVLEKMRYTEDEVVANYYAEILAAASKKDTHGKILLSFIEILNRLSSDEIRILEYINSPKNFVIINGNHLSEVDKTQFGILNNHSRWPLGTAIPIIDVKIEYEKKSGYFIALNNFTLLSEKVKLEFPLNVELYVDNLVSLGLVKIQFGIAFAFKAVYDELKEHVVVKSVEKELKQEEKISFVESRLELTNLCLSLLALCSK